MQISLYRKQRGVAFIMAMLILAIAVTVSASLVYQQQLDIRLTGNILRAEQAWQYVPAAEDLAGIFLAKDRQNSEIDSLSEDWATPLPPLDIPGGVISAKIEDLQGRFNLNNLVLKATPPIKKPETFQKETYQNLLIQLELDTAIFESTSDWIDTDTQSKGSFGAESDYYLNLTPPYLAADDILINRSELRMIRGIDAKAYQKLLPVVTTLPKYTLININTAPATLLKSLGLDDPQVQTVLEQRSDKPYKELESFLNLFTGENKPPAGVLSMSSNYFQLSAEIWMEPVKVQFNSILFRDKNGTIQVISRDFATG